MSFPVAGEAAGCVASAGCAELGGGVVSVGCVISGEVALSAAAFRLFVCLAGVVIGRLRFFQIVEERISPGCEPVDIGFIFLYSAFKSLTRLSSLLRRYWNSRSSVSQ